MSESADRLKNTIVYIRQTVITTAMPFVVLLIVARFLTPEDFGAYALSQVYAIVATGLFSVGLHVGYERNYFKYSGNANSLSGLHNSILGFVLLSYSIVGLLTLAFLGSISDIVGVTNHALLLIVFLGQSLDRLAQFYLLYFRNAENARCYSNFRIAAAAINAGVSLLLIVVIEMGVLGLAIGYALSWLVVICFMFVRVFKEINLRLDWVILKEALKISLPVTPRSLVVIMGAQSDKYILGLLSTIGGVGIYNIAYRISSVINSYMTALQNAYTPMLYKMMFAEQSSTQQGMAKTLTLITYFSILPAVLLAIFSSEIVWLLLPANYAQAADVLLILAIYFGVIFFGKISGVQLIFAKKTGLTTVLSIAFAVLNIALNIPLIGYFGALGAAFATLLTGSLYTLTSYYVAQKYCHIEWEGGSIAVIVSTLLASGLVALLMALFVDSYTAVLAIKICLLVFYGYLGCRFGIISRENFQKLMAELRGRQVTAYANTNGKDL